MNYKKNISFEELSQLIVDAIAEEPIFDKKILAPRIKSILKVFNWQVSQVPRIEKEETATTTQKRLLHIEKKEKEAKFWKNKCKEYLP
jgi:hypothetical protein